MSPKQATSFDAALRLLALRPRTEAELRRRLGRRGFGAEAIEAAMARLGELGLVDDDAFAHFWVEQRAAFRPSGRRRLFAELRAKGVARETVDAALQGQDDAASIEALARRRADVLGDLDAATLSRRLEAFLVRRGYQPSLARLTVRRVLRERAGNGS
ncbi:MAG TPA: regulatory protein RecX [Dehalococcoidia bacterium]|nr:regulatory protein RecX [Dehalococcoidia bacterium]